MAKLSAPTQRKIDALLRDSLQRHGNVCVICEAKAQGPSKAKGWSFFMVDAKGAMATVCSQCKGKVHLEGRFFKVPRT